MTISPDEVNLGNPLGSRLPCSHVFDEFLSQCLITFDVVFRNDVSFRPLACVSVWDAHDGDVFDVRVTEEQIFEFGGCDADAFDFDHFLDAVGDGQHALVVDEALVPGVEPAVLVKGLGGGFGVVEVAHGDLGASCQDLLEKACSCQLTHFLEVEKGPLPRRARWGRARARLGQ